ncbi:MAG TPA: hypothetical protein VLJ41_15515 [Segetibacter sp.]|nr:hypothetical protein [Segetibacter sp.]
MGQRSKNTADTKGRWKVNLQTPKAGGPFTVNINQSTQVVLKDVLLDESYALVNPTCKCRLKEISALMKEVMKLY